jgi:alpha-galactosidase
MIISADRKHALAWNIDVLNSGNAPRRFLRLHGLNPKRDYAVVGTKEIWGGDYLHAQGLLVPAQSGDFQSTLWELKAIS